MMEWCESQDDNPASPAPLLTVWCAQCKLPVSRVIVSEVTQLVADALSKHCVLESINCLLSTPGGPALDIFAVKHKLWLIMKIARDQRVCGLCRLEDAGCRI